MLKLVKRRIVTFVDVQASTRVDDAVKILGPYVEFIVEKADSLELPKTNAPSCAFALMMTVQKDRSILPERLDEADKKRELKKQNP